MYHYLYCHYIYVNNETDIFDQGSQDQVFQGLSTIKLQDYFKTWKTKQQNQREGEHESRLRESVARKDLDQDVSDAFA